MIVQILVGNCSREEVQNRTSDAMCGCRDCLIVTTVPLLGYCKHGCHEIRMRAVSLTMQLYDAAYLIITASGVYKPYRD